jgi:hypothetical protein
MSDSEEKPFEATPRRIAKARREGDVARSSELAVNCSFAAAACGVAGIAASIASLGADALAQAASLRPAPPSAGAVAAVALVPILCASLAGTFATLLQNGGLAFVPVGMKVERLNPVQGIRRVFSRETLRAFAARDPRVFMCCGRDVPGVCSERTGAARLNLARPFRDCGMVLRDRGRRRCGGDRPALLAGRVRSRAQRVAAPAADEPRRA